MLDLADTLYRDYLRCHLKTKRVYAQDTKKVEIVENSDILCNTFMPCSKKRSKPFIDAFNSVYKQGHSLETLRIIDCMQKMDKLIKVLMTPDQLLLFSLIPIYEIDYFSPHSDSYDFAPFDFNVVSSFKEAADRLNCKEQKSDLDINILRHTAYLTDGETFNSRP